MITLMRKPLMMTRAIIIPLPHDKIIRREVSEIALDHFLCNDDCVSTINISV